jgi:hypothetical protein
MVLELSLLSLSAIAGAVRGSRVRLLYNLLNSYFD